MTEKRFTLREPKIDNDIGCEEIADNGQWITYGEIVNLLNDAEHWRKMVIELIWYYEDKGRWNKMYNQFHKAKRDHTSGGIYDD